MSTPIEIACKNGNLDELKRLVQNGAVNEYDLCMAFKNGHLEVVKYLIENGADIHVKDNLALIRASRDGHLEIVKYLLENGADIHAMDDDAFRVASQYGHLEVVKYLIEMGANIHANDDCALRMASLNGHSKVVKYLYSFGVSSLFQSKPHNIVFRDTIECPISGEVLNDHVKKVGCSTCLQVFKKESLEKWFSTKIIGGCPYCRSKSKFYIV